MLLLRKGNPWIDFLVVFMAGSVARGRARARTTEMVAILQQIGWQRHAALIYSLLLWYWTFMLWSFDTYQNKVSSDQLHVNMSRAHRGRVLKLSANQYWFFIGSRAHVSLACKQGWVVLMPVNPNTGLKVNWSIHFSCKQMFLTPFFVYFEITPTQNRGIKRNWKADRTAENDEFIAHYFG